MLLLLFLIIFGNYLTINAQPSENPYTVQMHIHGHSHHNGVGKPGSMQWHSYFAKQTNTDVIWWTDHSSFYDLNGKFILNLDSGKVDANNLDITGLKGSHDKPDKLKATVTGGSPQVSLSNGILSMSLSTLTLDNNFKSFFYNPRGTSGRLSGFLLPRPVSSDAILEMDVERGILSSNNKIEVHVALSYHFEQQVIEHRLIYRLVDINQTYLRTKLDDKTVLIEVPTSTASTKLQFHLLNDAHLLTDGDDNVITEIGLVISARSSASVSCNFSNISLYSNSPDVGNQFSMLNYFTTKYEQQYNVKQIVGTEFGVGIVHLNIFLPDSTKSAELYSSNGYLVPPAQYVKSIHNKGGVASYNHMFGTEHVFETASQSNQDYRTDTMINFIFNNKAYYCDMLEIYNYRGKSDLNHHLQVWDALTAKGLFLYGNGVSDSHGDVWDENTPSGFWTTWIWAEDNSVESLIKAIKKGRLYFGNHYRFSDKFDFTIGNAKMGDRVYAISNESELKVSIGKSNDLIFKLVQGLIDTTGSALTYLRNREVIIPSATYCIDISKPCFVRIEVYDNNNTPILFSNPIIFLGTDTTLFTEKECDIYFSRSPEIIIAMENCFPNPFSGDIWLPYYLSDSLKNFKVVIYDALGRTEKTIKISKSEQDFYLYDEGFIRWDGTNNEGTPLSSGSYFYQISTDDKILGTKKIILMK